MSNNIQTLTVIGSGTMGHQIALLGALAGYETTVQDINPEALIRARQSVERLLEERVKKGKLSLESMASALQKLHWTTSLEEATQHTQFVIEAIVEKLDVKQALFRELDHMASPEAILATNSSTIVSSKLASVTQRPDRVLNMHFFYPPLVMDMVEIVMNEQTSQETAQAALQMCQRMGRTAVLLRKEISGFIANRILGAIVREAAFLYEEGIADFESIDLVVKKALGHPMGPFELMDLSGLDVFLYVMEQQYAESNNPSDLPPRFLQEKVARGELGRKTGNGFYTYK